jgi:dehydrodolichyl diphosphate syntase complex subunit NUS1
MDVVDAVCSFILLVIHFLVNLYEKISKAFTKFLTPKQDINVLLDSTKQLTKIPSSIAFISPSEDVRNETDFAIEEKLVQIIKWCAVIGIPYVSIYDEEGEFILKKSYFEQRLKYLNKLPNNKNNPDSRSTSYRLKVIDGSEDMFFGVDATGTHSVRIQLLSEEDGRKHIVKVAKDLVREASEIMNNNPSNGNGLDGPFVTLATLEKRMKEEYDFPDPEVVIRLNPTPCLFGFLPWQVRLSEIMLLPDCDGNNDPSGRSCLQAFTNVLFRYSKCEQRFGT